MKAPYDAGCVILVERVRCLVKQNALSQSCARSPTMCVHYGLVV